ncbi:unnamed protein product [Didymodactylos carnosus]|uniref:Cytochrome P450 n=1 Tax=Didymodactylos carnosus TaxID=1234261 RepID=A0A815WL27_9BILA|nr:unnamed protein product [Didymodactylos carnosus]CAF4407507.1 unnamed protein product [Didymodactylos carnosus]
MSALALDIVTGCVFGSGLVHDKEVHALMHRSIATAMSELEHRMFTLIGVLPIVKSLPLKSKLKIDEAKRDFMSAVKKIIDDRRHGLTQSVCKGLDLLDLLLSAESDGQKLTSEEIVQESATMVIAGHETTSTLMTWTLYVLAQHPKILLTLQKEIDSILRGQPPSADTLSQLIYTEAVLKESLRLYSPVPNITRMAVKDNTIVAQDGKEIFIRRGTDVFLDLYTLHHLEKYWPNADTFDPERFLNKNETHQSTIFLPFSAGTRNCIGQSFALMEAKIMLSMIVQEFEFELVPGQTFVPEMVVTMRPKDGIWVKMKSRQL